MGGPVGLDPRVRRAVANLECAREACSIADQALGRARAGVAETHRLRAAREAWRHVWSEYCHQQKAFMVCCAYCARMRSSTSEWVSIPVRTSEFLHHSSLVRLSHGYCSDCIARHFPDQGAGTATASSSSYFRTDMGCGDQEPRAV
jgi:hypothetical protein